MSERAVALEQETEIDHDRRVLILAPTKKDAIITQALLIPAGVQGEICESLSGLIAELEAGAAAVLIAEELVASGGANPLADVIAKQPPWSDLPVLVLTRPGADSGNVDEALRTLGNVTLLERPLRVATLMSAIQTALRARSRQYQIRGHLEERVRSETALRVADQRKDEFLATLGHELRNPLAPMQAGLQLLKLGNLSDPRCVRAVEVMGRLVQHLVRLVDDLLEVSRITRGLVEIRRAPVDLNAVLRTAIETGRPLVDVNKQELTIDLPPEPLCVSGDQDRLTQVFANLLNNASKYTDTGGHIAVSAASVDGWAEVSVRDDGIGIPASRLTTVFDMFTQVDRSDRRAQGGLGIGLTLVRSLVSMHGGEVEARSDGPNMGSEFIVRLPRVAARTDEQLPDSRTDRFPPCRILIVDDNHDAAETLGMLLSELGATIDVAHNGPDALRALETFAPHAVLLDIGMPGMDGYEVSRHVRSSNHKDVLLIALTGWGQLDDRERSKRAGFDHHLVKPPDIDRLRSILVARTASANVADATKRRR
ncbi:MAG TPA: ATP-binding protein [Vicinamibacterales bacterium]|jgi:signal transduction histidine kinase/ActR/RegA family two-component response regulator